MVRWEYLCIAWNDSGISVWPAEKFDLAWFKERFPKAKVTDIATAGKPAGVIAGYWIMNPDKWHHLMSLTTIAYLGSQGWEAVNISGNAMGMAGSGEAWLRRPLEA